MYNWKNHFYEMKGDVGLSLHEKERNKMPTPRHKVTHNPIPTSLLLCMLFVCLFVGCVHRAWNPNFCGRISETGAVLCCNDSDMCNQYLIPTLLQPTLFTKTEALQSISLIHPTPSVSDTVTIKAKVLSTFNPLLLRTTPERGSLSSALLTKTPSPTSEPEAKGYL